MTDFSKFAITVVVAGAIVVCFDIYTESKITKAAISQGLVQCPDARSKGGVLWQHSCN